MTPIAMTCLDCGCLTDQSRCLTHRTQHQLKRRGVKSGWQQSANRKRILTRDNYTCQICGLIGEPDELEVDHIIPLEQGGLSTDTNLRVLCIRCNQSRRRGAKKS